VKILLIGEYSALHLNLKNGLTKLGHEVNIISDGDGYKNIKNDLNLPWFYLGIRGRINKKWYLFKNRKILNNNDVVQLISPFVLNNDYSGISLDYIFKKNKKTFLGAFGTVDPTYMKHVVNLKYNPYQNAPKNIKLRQYPKFSQKDELAYNEICNRVQKIIASSYECFFCYHKSKYKNKVNKEIIPFPINLEEYNFKKIEINDKIIIHHGIQKGREFFKGSKIILAALFEIKEKYKNDVEIVTPSSLPFKEYLSTMANAHIVIDQCYGYSSGYNALIAMSMGKVVLGGNEYEYSKLYDNPKCPVLNIEPNKKSILDQLEKLILDRKKIIKIGQQSRNFIEHYHDHVTIAKSFINQWNEC